MVLEREIQQKAEEKFLREDEKKDVRNSPSPQKHNRIKKNSTFKNIFRDGERFYTNNLGIIFVRKEGFKFGITFKKGAKPAVKRNKIKRRIMQIIQSNKTLVTQNIYMVIHISKPALELSFKELKEEFTHLLKKANITK